MCLLTFPLCDSLSMRELWLFAPLRDELESELDRRAVTYLSSVGELSLIMEMHFMRFSFSWPFVNMGSPIIKLLGPRRTCLFLLSLSVPFRRNEPNLRPSPTRFKKLLPLASFTLELMGWCCCWSSMLSLEISPILRRCLRPDLERNARSKLLRLILVNSGRNTCR